MKKNRWGTNFSVGFVLFVATILVITGLFVVESGWSIFAQHAEYRVRVPNASGMRPGSVVYLAGVQVGTVAKIGFSDDPAVEGVDVTFRVDRSCRERIREDSYAWLQSQGLLGDIAIHVRLGSSERPVLAPGAFLTYKERSIVEDLVGEKISAGTADLLQETIKMLEEINRGEGTLGQLLKNPELYKNLNSLSISMDGATRQLHSISEEFEGVLKDIHEQKGTLGKLIFSEEYADEFTRALENSGRLVANLERITDSVRRGEGMVGKLFSDSALHDRGVAALENLSRISSRLDRLLGESEAAGGLVARLFRDGETGEEFSGLVARLERSAGSLEKILDTIERGDGSLGMLVQDPSIAASVRDVFRGVKELGLVQRLVVNAEEAGREAYLRGVDFARSEDREVRRVRAIRAIADLRQGESSTQVTSGSPDSVEGTPVPVGGEGSEGSPQPATAQTENGPAKDGTKKQND